MKLSYYTLLAAVLIVAALAFAGCSSVTPPGTSTSSAGTQAPAAASGTAPASSGGTCPVVTAATSWTGKWVSWSNSDICDDGRVYFYPPTTDNPDPWDSTHAGVEDFPVTFTQTGCDVTGSITVGPNGTLVAPPGCPITLTGKVDSTGAVAGTWHAYCNIEASGASSSDGTTDSGSWSLNMEPGGSTFIGTFGPSAADTAKYKADSCSNANSNWVGKRG
ncbi:MAG: hypothetical protein ACYDEZ_09125 [Methanoregula sp.]|jgi:hypothetical protein